MTDDLSESIDLDEYIASSIAKNDEQPNHPPQIKPLNRWRQTRVSRIVGIVVAATCAIIFFLYFPAHADRHRLLEIIANVLIVAGTGFTASGVVLDVSTSSWLKRIVIQEGMRKRKTMFLRESEHTRALISIIHSIGVSIPDAVAQPSQQLHTPGIENYWERKPIPLTELLEKLRIDLQLQRSGFKHLYVMNQAELARLFLDASRTARYGTLLIIAGTLILTVMAYAKP